MAAVENGGSTADAAQQATQDAAKQLEMLNSVRSIQTTADMILNLTSKKWDMLDKIADKCGQVR
jgi:hypothetical protein